MIFDGDLKVVAGAARRWHQRTKIRDARQGQSTAEIEDSSRVQARLDRLAHAAAQVAVPPPSEAILPNTNVLREIGLERVIGQHDFQGIAFLERALAVSRFVGRVNIRSSHERGVGFGTGFMVSPRLFLTNNHVLPDLELARFSEVEFDYQYDRFGKPLPVVPFNLQPETFFPN